MLTKTAFLFASILLLSCIEIFGQCIDGSQPECTCETAQILCSIDELDGFILEMTPFQHPQDGPSPLCPGTSSQSDNPNWFAFTVWCNELELDVSFNNCVAGNGGIGGQVAIFTDCTFTEAVACNVETANCNTQNKILSMSNLTIGKVYYFVVDGCYDSYCDVGINISGVCGSEVIDGWSQPISGDLFSCVGIEQSYTAEILDGARQYIWSVDGSTLDNTTTNILNITWPSAGIYQLCVDAANEPCVPVTNDPPPNCTSINVLDYNAGAIIADDQLCISTELSISISGNSSSTLSNQSILIVDNTGIIVDVISGITGSFESDIPSQYTVYSYNYPLNQNAPEIGSLLNEINCAQTCCDLVGQVITFDGLLANILATDCEVDNTPLEPLDDIYYFDINVSGPSSGNWQSSDGLLNGTYGSTETFGPFQVSGGNLQFTLQDAISSVCSIDITITPPIRPVINAGQDVTLTCQEPSTILMATVGANQILNYNWLDSNGNTVSIESSVEVIDHGLYTLIAQNVFNSCTAIDVIEVGENINRIQLKDLDIIAELCLGDNDGSITINEILGGSAPYTFTLNNDQTNTEGIFNFLEPGEYNLNITNSEGCILDTSIFFNPGLDLNITILDSINVQEDNTVTLSPSVNVNLATLETINWQSIETVSCDTCLITSVSPIEDHILTLSIENNIGCISSKEIYIHVIKRIEAHMANIFSPNGDGINDFLTLQTNDQVDFIKEMQVFDRWGNLIFQKSNFIPNEINEGWDGTFKGNAAAVGVYSFFVNYSTIQNTENTIVGNTTLIR